MKRKLTYPSTSQIPCAKQIKNRNYQEYYSTPNSNKANCYDNSTKNPEHEHFFETYENLEEISDDSESLSPWSKNLDTNKYKNFKEFFDEEDN